MILFLRDKNNNTIVDTECYTKDGYVEISSGVCIDYYSKFLLESDEALRDEIIAEFDALQELRGWLWESYFMGRKNTDKEYDDVIEALRVIFRNLARKYDLGFVED